MFLYASLSTTRRPGNGTLSSNPRFRQRPHKTHSPSARLTLSIALLSSSEKWVSNTPPSVVRIEEGGMRCWLKKKKKAFNKLCDGAFLQLPKTEALGGRDTPSTSQKTSGEFPS